MRDEPHRPTNPEPDQLMAFGEAFFAGHDLVEPLAALRPPGGRVDYLGEVFALSDNAVSVLLVGMAARVAGAGNYTVSAAMVDRRLGAEAGVLARSALLAWDFLFMGVDGSLTVDPVVADWLAGGPSIDPRLVDRVSRPPPGPTASDWPIDEAALLVRSAVTDSQGPVVLRLRGRPGTGRRNFAIAVAATLERRLMLVDARGLPPDEWVGFHRHIQRAALLEAAPIAWLGAGGRVQPSGRPVIPVQFDLLGPDDPPLAADAVHAVDFAFGPVGSVARRQLWPIMLPAARTWRSDAIDRLAAARPVTLGDMGEIAARQPGSVEEAIAQVRHLGRAKIETGVRVSESRLGWDDLVLPDRVLDALRRFAEEADLLPDALKDPGVSRLWPYGAGAIALFAGTPGTGKTMAAHVVANALERDLYVVDTAMVVSKYVGETSRNLRELIEASRGERAVFLFDEADTLFARRTEVRDAHDRFANMDTNNLLQMLETRFEGVAILATNRRDEIDSAVGRRLRHVIEFPRPDEALRCALWTRLAAEMMPSEANDLAPAIAALARFCETTGAQIKGATLTAYLAARRTQRRVTADDLIAGVDRELAKEGRALTDRELARLGRHDR